MSKLWAKGYNLNHLIESYMTGADPQLDLLIAPYDCQASLAHATMLAKLGLITQAELAQIQCGLAQIQELVATKQFTIEPEEEDIHTAIENYLTRNFGVIGKKIHTGRSRNDQVLTALRLYSKAELVSSLELVATTVEVMLQFAHEYQAIAYPGRTHFQKAMPSSLGLWMGAFVEALLDDGKLLLATYNLIDQCPLGSAASYGVALPLDRQLTSDLLGFAKVQNNVLYANNSRGKFESMIIHGLSQVMLDLAKLASDIIIFSAPEFGYLVLPLEFCPGSSLMPNKKNPDPLEVMRAKSAQVMANWVQVMETIRGLPSGYNRDFQETKRPLIESFTLTQTSLQVATIIIRQLGVNRKACFAAFTPDVFATDALTQLVKQGVPFREAYGQVAASLDSLENQDPQANILNKSHQGASGNLGLAGAYAELATLRATIKQLTNQSKITGENDATSTTSL
jgi:argininosuccinate lyase